MMVLMSKHHLNRIGLNFVSNYTAKIVFNF